MLVQLRGCSTFIAAVSVHSRATCQSFKHVPLFDPRASTSTTYHSLTHVPVLQPLYVDVHRLLASTACRCHSRATCQSFKHVPLFDPRASPSTAVCRRPPPAGVHRLPVSALQPTEYQSAEHDVDARARRRRVRLRTSCASATSTTSGTNRRFEIDNFRSKSSRAGSPNRRRLPVPVFASSRNSGANRIQLNDFFGPIRCEFDNLRYRPLPVRRHPV